MSGMINLEKYGFEDNIKPIDHLNSVKVKKVNDYTFMIWIENNDGSKFNEQIIGSDLELFIYLKWIARK